MTAKYQIGEHVASYNSGLVYVVKFVNQLDLTGETFGYAVRRLKGGIEHGPQRVISECGLVPFLNGDPESAGATRKRWEEKMEFQPMYLLGRLANGAERGKGRIVHAVPPRGPALCGTDYGRMSAGWQHAESAEITCSRCLDRLAIVVAPFEQMDLRKRDDRAKSTEQVAQQ
jgi:hypothetical protein